MIFNKVVMENLLDTILMWIRYLDQVGTKNINFLESEI